MESTPSSAFVSTFKQLYLQELQSRQTQVTPSEVGALYDKYKEKHANPKEHAPKTLEQILLALPLWLVSQDKPSHLSQTEYIRLVNSVEEEMLVVHELLKTSFNIA